MSISGPASSRWSRAARAARRRPRAASCPRRPRVGSGGFGSAASASSSSASTRRELLRRAPSPRRATSCIAAIASAASPPAFLARAIACEASFWRARSALDLGQQLAPARVELQHARPGRASEPSRRRASAARTGVGVAADRLQVEHRRLRRGRRLGASSARVLRDELRRPSRRPRRRRCSAASGRRRSRRCGSRRGRCSRLSLRWSKFGPSLYSRVVRLDRRALRAGRRQRVAARAALVEELRAVVDLCVRLREVECPRSPQATTPTATSTASRRERAQATTLMSGGAYGTIARLHAATAAHLPLLAARRTRRARPACRLRRAALARPPRASLHDPVRARLLLRSAGACTPRRGRSTLQVVNRGRMPAHFRIEKARARDRAHVGAQARRVPTRVTVKLDPRRLPTTSARSATTRSSGSTGRWWSGDGRSTSRSGRP